ncbi:MarR family winged helix-turn-helix transcriptional regulator [Aciditerrimonas ferrireducens]|uniref:MarR family winged helix-turn-helix transcriptional regulator n=1 Tax=Aciditerrimonas ferrireducens TaxID=667306 RepID=UPI0020030814|nr:MarR family winged helix-turn-helix transcriptional regulator [Aciditerrimonas ferrireducens]MCK4177694.1 MarR family winged helix-turn-helix transcriptional regulator [Aciditerrimonas ferrireducens]
MPRYDVPDEVYRQLLAFRTELRRFLRWSETQARRQGLTPAQHQLLLAIRGSPDPAGPTLGEVAEALLLRHHSAVGLVDRAETAGLCTRERDPEDHRVVRLRLTPEGRRRLAALSSAHLEELARLAGRIPQVAEGLGSPAPGPRTRQAGA